MKKFFSLFMAIFIIIASLFTVSAENVVADKNAVLSALYESDISTIREAIDLKIITCEELTAYYLERIEKYNTPYNCFITLCDDALEIAKQRDAQLQKGENDGLLFGIPVVSMLYPNESIVLMTSMIALVVPIINICAVVILQLHAGMKTDIKSLVISVLKNPMVIATLSGFAIKLIGVEIPTAVMKTISEIGGSANTVGLIVLGASFELPAISQNLKKLVLITSMRMIICPLVMMSIAVMLGYRGIELATVMVIFGAPTAVSSFATAVQMKGDGVLASQAVMSTTAVSAITIFTWVFALTSLNML